MTVLRTRRLQPEDEGALNECYLGFVRRTSPDIARSLDMMRWVWHRGPGGPAESWVVEVENPDGSWRIVGHHALCPVRFTLGPADLLSAKTINTFLLPEFRSKFLYLRFEQQCLAEAGSRYDVTYSNGQGIFRLRKPLGYAVEDLWIQLEHGSRHLDLPTRALMRLVQRRPHQPWSTVARAWAQACAATAPRPSFEPIEYTADEAIQSAFFADFWLQARGEAGMSPRRDVADLTWRFWRRPRATFVTLVHSWAGGARGYCVVDTANPYHYHLADFFVTPMRPDLLDSLLDALFHWRARRGALTISFRTTVSGQPPPLMDVLSRRLRPHPLARLRNPMQFSYRVSPHGRAAGLPMPRWNVTDLLRIERPDPAVLA